MTKIIGFIIAALSPWLARAGELPPPILPAGVGVNIHFDRGHEKELDRIAAAGFKFVRMDLSWSQVERAPGQFDWSAADELTAHLQRRGLRAYFILDYSNPLYEGQAESTNPITGKLVKGDTMSPQHPDSVAAYARWAAAAAAHFRGRHVILEIWNEPNISFWKPKPDAAQYCALALAAAKAIRAADPQATIVAPASSTFDWNFLETFLQSGALTYLDAVSVHPYRGHPPESAAADFERLRALIAKYSPERAVPIVSGEWGYSTRTKGVSLQTQADYLVRQQLSNLLNGVPLSIWYDWKNDGDDPAENEHNFGTVTSGLTPKPAYRAAQTLTRELAGYGIRERWPLASEKDFALVLTNAAGATKLAAWTLGAPHNAGFDLQPAPARKISIVDEAGKRSKLAVIQNHFSLELSGTPQYVALRRLRLQ